MNNIFHFEVLFFTIAGVVIFFVLLLATGKLTLSLPVALDFWTGAGLTKLTGQVDWKTIGAVAAIILLRKTMTLHFFKTKSVNTSKCSV